MIKLQNGVLVQLRLFPIENIATTRILQKGGNGLPCFYPDGLRMTTECTRGEPIITLFTEQ